MPVTRVELAQWLQAAGRHHGALQGAPPQGLLALSDGAALPPAELADLPPMTEALTWLTDVRAARLGLRTAPPRACSLQQLAQATGLASQVWEDLAEELLGLSASLFVGRRLAADGGGRARQQCEAPGVRGTLRPTQGGGWWVQLHASAPVHVQLIWADAQGAPRVLASGDHAWSEPAGTGPVVMVVT